MSDPEVSLQEWQQQHLPTDRAVYYWPGHWPEQDLVLMLQALANWHYSAAVIYYTEPDPSAESAVALFRLRHPDWWVRVIPAAAPWQPPVDLIVMAPDDIRAEWYFSAWCAGRSTELTQKT
jgi:hypothetical protein